VTMKGTKVIRIPTAPVIIYLKVFEFMLYIVMLVFSKGKS
jgi:hypothetical protein